MEKKSNVKKNVSKKVKKDKQQKGSGLMGMGMDTIKNRFKPYRRFFFAETHQ